MGMTLDIAIGLISVYLLLSVLCSAIHEALAGIFRLRAANLARSIDRLLLDRALDARIAPLIAAVTSPRRGVVGQLASLLRRKLKIKKATPQSPLAVALRQHPLIKALKHGWIGPSYIPSHAFVAALVDTLRAIDWSGDKAAVEIQAGAQAGDAPPVEPLGDSAAGGGSDRELDPLKELKSVIARLPDESELKRAFHTILDGTVTSLVDANARIERWFNDAMDRAAGSYKRHSQLLITTAALVLCVGFNADSVMIANSLSRDTAVRTAVLSSAQSMAKTLPGGAPASDPAADDSQVSAVIAALAKGGTVQKQLSALDLQITWGDVKEPEENSYPKLWSALGWVCGNTRIGWLRGVIARLFTPGILITAAAASLGAPFWFDLLNKLVNLRAAGKTPEPGGTPD